jgi:hypothetical protein
MKYASKALLVLVILSAFLIGCSQQGYLTVDNKTGDVIFVEVDGDDEEIDGGDDHEWEFEFPGFLLNLIQQESENVDVSWEGLFVFPDATEVEIEADDDITIDVNPTAGAIVIDNNASSASIIEVQFRLNNGAWSGNLISGSIGPGQWAIWRVEPGTYNIYVLDDYGYWPGDDPYPTQSVAPNQMRVFEWNSSEDYWYFNQIPGPMATPGAPPSLIPAEPTFQIDRVE